MATIIKLSGGPPGAPGVAATVTVGTVTTSAAGSSAAVANAGTTAAAVLNFTIPRGNTGATGATGATGETGATGPAFQITSGPVTTSGAVSTIANGAITNAMLANGAVANLSGTNTGDQTNISGNAATVTTNANLTGVVTSVGNATSMSNTSLNSVIDDDPIASKRALGTFEGFAGQTQNCIAKLAAGFGTPAPLRIAIWGDSLSTSGGGITAGPLMAIKGWIAGYGGAYTGGAAAAQSFSYWINGRYDNVPNGGTVIYQKAGIYQVAGDTIAVYYIKESTGGTFNVETSVDGTTWVAATGGTGVSANNGTTIGAVFTAAVSTTSGATYRLRVTGASGNGVKVVGYGIYHTGANGGVVICDGLLNMSGHNLSEEVATPAAIVTPILTSVAPDLVISRMADFSFQWETAGVTISASTTNGSPNITFPSVTTEGIAVGSEISGTGIPGGTTVIATNGSTTATLSANATATGTATLSLRGAFLTMYDKIKVAAPSCDFVAISQTMADTSVDATNDRKRANEKMRAWAEANNETYIDATSFMGDTYTAGVAAGYLESDLVGHQTAAGAWMGNFILWNQLALGRIPMGRVSFFSQNTTASRGISDSGLSLKTNSSYDFEFPDMVQRIAELRVVTGTTTAEKSNRNLDWTLAGSTTSGDAWLKSGSTNMIKLKYGVGGGLQAPSDGGVNCGYPGGRFVGYFTGLNSSGAFALAPVAQTATTAAVSTTVTTTALTATAPAQAITLANGSLADGGNYGQIKTIMLVATSGGGTAVLTPATKTGYSTITFSAVGDMVTLQFFQTYGWMIIAIRGAISA